MNILTPRPLTREAFAPFGQVIETRDAECIAINGGNAQRFHDLARVSVLDQGGHPLISLFRAQPRAQPVRLDLMERHPLGSQAFLPLGQKPYLVVVAEDDGGRPGKLHAFATSGWQGVNYDKGVWHHPLLALDEVCDFIVVDRGGEGCNLEEYALRDAVCVGPLPAIR